jgi:hypothetical protein
LGVGGLFNDRDVETTNIVRLQQEREDKYHICVEV